MNYHVSLLDAIGKLAGESDALFTTVLQDGKMKVEYYAPLKVDAQTPHTQDELYIIASGEAAFTRNGETTQCKQGDVLFVPHGMEHRFLDFTDDFATWVVFYGDEYPSPH